MALNHNHGNNSLWNPCRLS